MLISFSNETVDQIPQISQVARLTNIAVLPSVGVDIGYQLKTFVPFARVTVVYLCILEEYILQHSLGVEAALYNVGIVELETELLGRDCVDGINEAVELIFATERIELIPIEVILLGTHKTDPVADVAQVDALAHEVRE